jgi:hypothetical protein
MIKLAYVSLPNNKVRKGSMVWFFRQTFCKKTLSNSVNQPAIQSLVTLAGLLPRLSRRRQTAPLPPLPQTVPTKMNGTTPVPAADQECSWWLEACERGRRGRRGRPTSCGLGRPAAWGLGRPAVCGQTACQARAGSGVRARTATWLVSLPSSRQTRRPRWRELGRFQAGTTRS